MGDISNTIPYNYVATVWMSSFTMPRVRLGSTISDITHVYGALWHAIP